MLFVWASTIECIPYTFAIFGKFLLWLYSHLCLHVITFAGFWSEIEIGSYTLIWAIFPPLILIRQIILFPWQSFLRLGKCYTCDGLFLPSEQSWSSCYQVAFQVVRPMSITCHWSIIYWRILVWNSLVNVRTDSWLSADSDISSTSPSMLETLNDQCPDIR